MLAIGYNQSMYKYDELVSKALKIIEDENIHFLKDLAAALGINERTLYYHKLHELQSIKEAVENQKRLLKKGLRERWNRSDNATLQIALYRLTADSDEFDALTQNKNKIEHSGEINTNEKDVKDLVAGLNKLIESHEPTTEAPSS